MYSSRLQELIDYSVSNNRVCPMPDKWHRLWKLLVKDGDKSILSLPLILGAWYETSDEEKRIRLHEHLLYSEKVGMLDEAELFLHQLNETHWYHSGD